jgi:glycosyltransferase involved in cell wall biosynthesis
MPVSGDRLSILALEPYYGGSHRAVLDALVEYVEADWALLTLPARKWKWRMRGAAITFAQQAGQLAGAGIPSSGSMFDLVFASTFVNLAEWRGLVGPPLASVPAVVYFHENQLVYPNRHVAEWDFQFPLTNITSALSAERCCFNTEWNRDRFLAAIPGFLRQFPDHQPKGVAERIAGRSEVLHPPFDPRVFDETPIERGERCRIVWPHRWEHDKNPEAFFSAVAELAAEGLDFEVVVAGQAFKDVPEPIRRAETMLGERLVHLGEPASRSEYARLLASSDVAVSTAVNEFFGIAMVEASYAGCFPLVPDRLAYPELYPAEMRYGSQEQLVANLRSLLDARPGPGAARGIASAYTVGSLAPDYRTMFAEVTSTR